MRCAGREPVCAIPPAQCCGVGICGAGRQCLICPGQVPICARPPAQCCGDGICAGGQVCKQHAPGGPICVETSPSPSPSPSPTPSPSSTPSPTSTPSQPTAPVPAPAPQPAKPQGFLGDGDGPWFCCQWMHPGFKKTTCAPAKNRSLCASFEQGKAVENAACMAVGPDAGTCK